MNLMELLATNTTTAKADALYAYRELLKRADAPLENDATLLAEAMATLGLTAAAVAGDLEARRQFFSAIERIPTREHVAERKQQAEDARTNAIKVMREAADVLLTRMEGDPEYCLAPALDALERLALTLRIDVSGAWHADFAPLEAMREAKANAAAAAGAGHRLREQAVRLFHESRRAFADDERNAMGNAEDDE